ncbi:carbohydrate ABC transporter permease [Paenibacillus methanolicus]|uniref:Multiple sugar transport system permease protein/cellobiose transport system permease protein n=1 Tax=Paenibacillus methanolicus TaxID=582686 RepID=A0A5S5CEE5_9BACL|nr:carbohydrate ABC transporter permease [Paenibacillus methanolicus]TYP76676.1 multiple sugar transport system permease protein/cellobiose transport system permease protein [Paenibacillus methanolicus]
MSTSTRTVIATTGIALLSVIALLPFYIMVVMGTYRNEDLFTQIVLLPGDYVMENLKTVAASRFDLAYWNSIVVSAISTVLSVFVSAFAGFAFAKYEFRFKSNIFAAVLLTMMIPGQLGLVAYVIEMRYLNLSGSLMPLILPWVANAFGVYWMTQFIRGAVPAEVIESARIDGCSDLGIFFRIVLAFIFPAVTTLSLLVFLWSWNNYLLPLIMINKPEMYTIPLGITTLGSAYRTDLAAQILGLSLGTLPVLVLFALGSKSFIRGLTAGSVKG